MTTLTHDDTIAAWITAANSHDLARFLSFFTADAVLDDPSVGAVFEGHDGIGEYFTSYFIGYDTQTALVSIAPRGAVVHVEVEFTGSFPGGRTGGTFDLAFAEDLIAHVRADLI